jgi:hypothetical protein
MFAGMIVGSKVRLLYSTCSMRLLDLTWHKRGKHEHWRVFQAILWLGGAWNGDLRGHCAGKLLAML